MAYLGEDIKKLGFGLMRLPMIGEDVDIEQTKRMVDLFLSRGFTYFDTAYGYLNGKSEAAAKTALVDRYPRDSFQLATKLPAWAGAKTAEEARGMFYTSLERTGAGYFDFYLLHNLGADRTEAFDRFGIWDFARSLKEKGLIKHLGFSMHDTAEALEAVLAAHPQWVRRVSVERLRAELEQALLGAAPGRSAAFFRLGFLDHLPVRPCAPDLSGLAALPLHPVPRWAGLCHILMQCGGLDDPAEFLKCLHMERSVRRLILAELDVPENFRKN